MNFSKSWSYAIRALIYLTEHRDEGPILSSVIAAEESIPAPFLVKILGTLAAAKIVESTRGRKGGFILNVDPTQITLQYITNYFDQAEPTGECILGHGSCRNDLTCPIHKLWVEPRKQINDFLNNTTLADLCRIIPDVDRKNLDKSSDS